ncbi:hypothetical protein FRB91_004046 [Serendipita sp. 411]|nr:hypothetical protein FRC19_009347 [Serendipita sp. 401]KAG8860258.1 hypothetical protein FRB91_004046 [Serendipita sp. 411]KAG9057157.1 hypothetical protein FS842_008449 [Serendipita sp. 407]
MSSRRHRKTQPRKEPLHMSASFLDRTSPSSANTAMMWVERMSLMNEVTAYRNENKHILAEPKQKEIVSIDEKMHGPFSSTSGLSWNKLGEIQFEMGKFAESEVSLRKAVEIREGLGEDFDTAVSRDNLARALEALGRMEEAKETRLRGRGPQNISCTNWTCTIQQGLGFDKLKTCSQCKSVFYCSPNCQKMDWKTRHKKTCKPPITTTDASIRTTTVPK